ncbi:MAG: DUF192 domain-containing protein [Alphaproteobacteria bacterium]|nr:DUF192 domain-containing protein [Alphaproteobacteria bacterium]
MKHHSIKLNLIIFLFAIILFYPNFSFALFERKGQVEIATTDGKLQKFNVEFARSEAEKATGLMFRERLADDEGMLFMWNTSSLRQFWMKNTLINLDILFIDSDYRVVHIEESAQKGSLRIISSLLPVQYVLEINAGQSQLRKITPGALLSAKNLPICC